MKPITDSVVVTLERAVDRSYTTVTGKLFVLAVLIFGFFLAVVLPQEASRSAAYFQGGQTPDSSFIYSSTDLYQMASAFGEEGRRYYIRSRFTFDVVWPLAYGLLLWTGIAYLGSMIRVVRQTRLRYVVLLPPLAVLLDFLENTSASVVMFFYPARIPIIPELAPMFTFGKWVTIGISYLILAGLALWVVVQTVKTMRA